MIKPKKAVQKMEPYNPPVSSRRGKLRMDFNENTLGCSPKVIKALKNLTRDDLTIYPEYSRLLKKIADYVNVKQDEVMLSDGSDEAIKNIMETYIEKGDEIVLPVPTFSMFRVYADVAEAKLKKVPYNKNLSFPAERVLKAISNRTKIVVLVNPNNPTGTEIKKEDIKRIVEKANSVNAVVIIDEAYYQFYGETSISLTGKYPNVIILQTFSKAFGLAALRLGYIISNRKNISDIKKASSPYSVNGVAVAAAIAALDDGNFVKKYVAEVMESKKMLYWELDKMGIKTYPSSANFIVADFGSRWKKVYDPLKERGILTRSQDSQQLLKGCIRITAGTRKQTKRFIKELNKVIKER